MWPVAGCPADDAGPVAWAKAGANVPQLSAPERASATVITGIGLKRERIGYYSVS